MPKKADIISLLGEGFHTAFRKIPVKNADEIHKLIEEMPDEDWMAILDFVYEGIKEELK
jgi:phenylpyruvate tautomerase PptA (4-oxalocrotonate tautomerase family)